MAFVRITTAPKFGCLSTDTKETVGIKDGSYLKEVDTGKEYVFLGGVWHPWEISFSGVTLDAETVNIELGIEEGVVI